MLHTFVNLCKKTGLLLLIAGAAMWLAPVPSEAKEAPMTELERKAYFYPSKVYYPNWKYIRMSSAPRDYSDTWRSTYMVQRLENGNCRFYNTDYCEGRVVLQVKEDNVDKYLEYLCSRDSEGLTTWTKADLEACPYVESVDYWDEGGNNFLTQFMIDPIELYKAKASGNYIPHPWEY